jgi:hypothetical protein
MSSGARRTTLPAGHSLRASPCSTRWRTPVCRFEDAPQRVARSRAGHEVDGVRDRNALDMERAIDRAMERD